MMKKHISFIVILLLLAGQMADAQKKALQQEDCERWRTVRDPKISEDGRWVTYRYSHLYKNDNPDLFLYDAERNKTTTLKNVTDFFFFGNGKWAKIVQQTPLDTTGQTVDSTFMVRLRDWKKIHWDKAAYPNANAASASITYTEPVEKNGKTFNRLVVWNVETGEKNSIERVGTYTLFNDRQSVIYEHKGDGATGLRVQDLKGKPREIFRVEKGIFGSYWFDEEKQAGTFTVASDSSRQYNPDLLYAFTLSPLACRLVVDFEKLSGIPEGLKISRRPYPLINGGRDIMLELEPVEMPRPQPRVKPDRGFELELWTWNEPLSHRRQRPSRGGFNIADYPKFVCHTDTKTCVKLAEPGVERFVVPGHDEYDYLFAVVSKPYLTRYDWLHELHSDVTLIRLADGKQQKILTDVREIPQWSPNGKHALWYDAEAGVWNRIDLATGKLRDISSVIGHPMYDELHDMPKAPYACGIAGWLDGGNSVVLYDRYDMWVIDLTGKKTAYSLTNGYGRKNRIELRIAKEHEGGLAQGALLSGFDTRTKAKHIYSLDSRGKVTPLTKGDGAIHLASVANHGKTCLWNRSSFTEFGDLWWSDAKFSRPRRITDANPQQADYLWGTARLERWTTFDGNENEGILFLPEGYDPSRKYPVIVTFYERHTDELFNYLLPEYSSSVIDVPTYVSNGYVVFMPDVHFKIGDPAESCYNCVVSGTQMLIDKGIADKDRIGVIGHSWGGYETAHLVTRTDIFRCASPGAAVSNVTSAYTALRGASGVPRMYVYEDAQGRLGKTLWEDRGMYIRNSPIFNADKIHTPLLIFHCDRDDAVPFAQGLDLFLAMRRLARPAWLLNYKGEGHALGEKPAMIDWGIRMRQFFDHYLKDAPVPRWMDEGISVDEQGYELKYELTSDK